jgi:CBS-domain-containing membrane protein
LAFGGAMSPRGSDAFVGDAMGLAVLLVDSAVTVTALSEWLATSGPHLAVIVDSAERPLGTVDLTDLAETLDALNDVARPAAPVRESSLLAHAIDRMVHERARALPVVDDQDRVVGLITDLDALHWVARHGTRA